MLKPVELGRFQKAVEKACDYLLLLSEKSPENRLKTVTQNHIFVKADRRYYRIMFENILFIGKHELAIGNTYKETFLKRMNV